MALVPSTERLADKFLQAGQQRLSPGLVRRLGENRRLNTPDIRKMGSVAEQPTIYKLGQPRVPTNLSPGLKPLSMIGDKLASQNAHGIYRYPGYANIGKGIQGVVAGYSAAEMTKRLLDRGGYGGGASGLSMGTGIAAGSRVVGGAIGPAGGAIGAAVSNIVNPGRRNPLDEIAPMIKGSIWQKIFSSLPEEQQIALTAMPDEGEDIESRMRTIAGLRNQVEKEWNEAIPEKIRPQIGLITEEEINNNIKNYNEIDRGRGPTSDLLEVRPPMKSVDGWLYIDSAMSATLPPLDRLIVSNYGYQQYIDALERLNDG